MSRDKVLTVKMDPTTDALDAGLWCIGADNTDAHKLADAFNAAGMGCRASVFDADGGAVVFPEHEPDIKAVIVFTDPVDALDAAKIAMKETLSNTERVTFVMERGII